MADLNLNATINLGRASVMLLDDSPEGMDVLVQIITAFGVKTLHRAASVAQAEAIARKTQLDLVLASANLRASSGYDFTSWLRRSKLDPNAFAATILITGHTVMSDIQKARDCGGDFIVTKPLSPAVLLERIIWVAREKRPFVSSETYVGPERRYLDVGPPAGQPNRRPDDGGEKAEAAPETAEPDEATRSMETAE